MPLGTSATCVQSPQLGDSMSFSARSASPTVSPVAADELAGEDSGDADADGDGEREALDAERSLVRTEAVTMRSVPAC